MENATQGAWNWGETKQTQLERGLRALKGNDVYGTRYEDV
jgi:hypothetical protein